MADRREAPYPPRDSSSSETDTPVVDLIFPNRERPQVPGFEPTVGQLEQAAGFGPPVQEAFRHRRTSRLARLLGRDQPAQRVTRTASGLVDRPVRRRRVLLGVGTGVVVAGGAAGATLLANGTFAGSRQPSGTTYPNTTMGLGAEGLAGSPSEAARIAGQATPTWPTPLDRDPVLHLLRRASFGPTLVDVVAVRQMGLDAWLDRQLHPDSVPDPVADQILAAYPTIGMSTEQIRAAVKDDQNLPATQLGHATVARQMWSNRQLFEVMVDFWANHLNITNPFDGGWDTRSPYDTDVIRAHALGRFADMLAASARHPAMMRYLDNASSQRKSVNENYGRELLELHTVGLDVGYGETDVRHSAYIMTGRTVDRDSFFVYDAKRHWVGPVQVLGFAHANDKTTDGLALGEQYLTYLATHPATAKRIAFKLARRFVCDDPPQTLVDRIAQSYLDNGTAVVPVLRTLFSSVEFWMSTGLKTRRPLENILATARIVGVAPGTDLAEGAAGFFRTANQLGHAPLGWGPPDGYPDHADAWGSAFATLGNWNAHRAVVAGRYKGVTYPKPETFVGLKPDTYGSYLDTLALRLVHQPMLTEHRQALLTFLGVPAETAVKDLRLGGKIDQLVPLVLDSVYHALR